MPTESAHFTSVQLGAFSSSEHICVSSPHTKIQSMATHLCPLLQSLLLPRVTRWGLLHHRVVSPVCEVTINGIKLCTFSCLASFVQYYVDLILPCFCVQLNFIALDEGTPLGFMHSTDNGH